MTCTARYHGTYSAVHHHGCTCPEAQPEYQRQAKRYSVASRRGLSLRVPAIGTIRRVQALQCLGYSLIEIKTRLGYEHVGRRTFLPSPSYSRGQVNAATAAKVDALFRELCMTPATGPHAGRLRAMAFNRGYAPPLAWDNIDDPDEQPSNDFLRLKRRRERQAKERARYHVRRAAGTERGSKVA